MESIFECLMNNLLQVIHVNTYFEIDVSETRAESTDSSWVSTEPTIIYCSCLLILGSPILLIAFIVLVEKLTADFAVTAS